ncbi:TonB-dependent receptor [Chitinophaga sp. 30R24]|uniref:TonB-dependent receptor n=1 Tax=Chitinophaga sp. 30R24 TaxID=3248838 RepID=UPI003B9044FC
MQFNANGKPLPLHKGILSPNSSLYLHETTARNQRPKHFVKFITFLLLTCSLGAYASAVAQKLTISKKNASLQEVFKEIEKQTGYQFFFSDSDLRGTKTVSLQVHDAEMEEVLRKSLSGQALTYEIVGQTVVIKHQKQSGNLNDLSTTSAVAPIQISGIVTDEHQEPLLGATVMIRGNKSKAAITDVKGRFTLSCNADDILLVSFIGYKTTEVAIQGRTQLNITLAANSNQLEETVVVAYGTSKKSVYTGAAAQISSKDFEKRPLNNVTNALVGAAPGIQSTNSSGAPDAGPGIRLRGFGSYSISSSPLYVVDGVPYDGSLGAIDPSDIATLSVLKDASTSALYGSRAANGVIIITTKKGEKNRNHLSFSANYGIVRRGLQEYDRVDAYQYYPLMWEAYRNSLAYGTTAVPLADAGKIASGLYPRFTSGANNGKQNYNGAAYSDISQLLLANPFSVPAGQLLDADGHLNPDAKLLYPEDLDWSKAAEKGGRSRQNYQLSYSGGTDKSDYYGSFGYTDMKGYLIKSDMKRFNGRLNLNVHPLTWFKSGLNAAGSYMKQNEDNTASSTGFVNPFYFSRYAGPIYAVHQHDASGAYILDEKGAPLYDLGVGRPFAGGRNAIYENLLNERIQNKDLISGRTYAEISFAPFLKLTTNFSADIENNLYQDYDNRIVGDGAPAGRSDRYTERKVSYTFNQLLNFHRSWNKHNVDVLAGHENYNYTSNFLEGYKQGQIVDGITELPNFSTINTATSYTDVRRIESYLSRLNYDYEGKYVLSASLRRDGNSRFAPAVRWATFWSVGGAWNIAQEHFFNTDVVNQLKLRASYGKVGNDGGNRKDDGISYYAYQAFYNLGRNNAGEPGFVQGTLGNDELTWESNNSFDLGLDFSLFDNRLSGNIDYFNRQSSGMIFSVPQPLSNGGTTGGGFTINTNVGDMYNRGIELQLRGEIVRTRYFRYSLTVNATTFKNQITRMPDNQPQIIDGTKQLSVGHSIYDYYLRHFYGVDPDNGDALYTAQTYNPASPGNTKIITNKNGTQDTVTSSISNAKYMYAGASSIPKLYGSLLNEFSYKNLTLSVTVTYQLGGKVYDANYANLMVSGQYGTALSTDILNRWQKKGDITKVPRMDNLRVSDFSGASDRWLTNASYLNINNITLSYKVPKRWLSHITGNDANVYLSGENLHMFSSRKGMNVNQSFNGTTSNTYTYNRIVTMGVNLNF